MTRCPSRRQFFRTAGLGVAGAALAPGRLFGQSIPPYSTRSRVALVSGNDRVQNVLNALKAVHDDIGPILRTKTSVLIKPNLVWMVDPAVAPACTIPDTISGILEYVLWAGFRGPIVIAEASAQSTTDAFNIYGYPALRDRYRSRSGVTSLELIDLSDEGNYVPHNVVDANLQVQPIRAAARLFDPTAFIISAAQMKTHDRVVATMSVKNMAMGAPLHANNTDGWWAWSHKPRMHDTYRLANVNIFQMAQRLRQYWGVALIDGYEGMEGDGPTGGTAVPSRVAIASTDFVAADRVGVECMGINPDWVGYLNYAWRMGLGQYDLANIDVLGPAISSVKRTYALHRAVTDEMQWRAPFDGCNIDRTPKVGRR